MRSKKSKKSKNKIRKKVYKKVKTSNVFTKMSDLNLTETEIEIVDNYTGGESLWINNYLRDRNIESLSDTQKASLKRATIHLNNIINKSPLSTSDTIVYRGAEAMYKEWRQLDEGSELILTSKGLISTSFKKNTALSFIEEDEDCCFLILNLPKGTRGLYISSDSMFNEEDELLLPHGSKFVITNKKFTNHKYKKIITYEAILVSQI